MSNRIETSCKSCGDMINSADTEAERNDVCIHCWFEFAETSADPMLLAPVYDFNRNEDRDIPF